MKAGVNMTLGIIFHMFLIMIFAYIGAFFEEFGKKLVIRFIIFNILFGFILSYNSIIGTIKQIIEYLSS